MIKQTFARQQHTIGFKKYGKVLRSFNLKQIPKLSGKINIDEFVFKIKK